MSGISEGYGSNYLLMNAADIFWTDDDIVADMLASIRADEDRLRNWLELTGDADIAEACEANNYHWANYYSMNEPSNPYKVGDVETRVFRLCQRIWKQLKEQE